VAAVFFDLVGTLVDEDSDIAAHELLMARVKARFGLEDSVGDLLGEYHLLGADQLEAEDAAARGPSFTRAYTATFVAMLEKRGFKPSAQDEGWFHEQYFACHREQVRLVPEAAKVLDKVKDLGVHIGLVSDIDKPMLEDHLDFLGLQRTFDSVTCSEEVRARKPDPQVFAFALRQAGCAPRDAVMVGDSLERDVDGALAAGMKAVLIDRHNARVTDAPRLRNLKGVPKVVRKLLRL
jgi:2-haloacid dehalogenase